MQRRCIRDLFFSVKFVVKFQNRCPPPPRRRRRRCCCCCSLVKPPPLLVVVVVLVFAERGEKGGGEGKDIILFFCLCFLSVGFLLSVFCLLDFFLFDSLFSCHLMERRRFIHSFIHQKSVRWKKSAHASSLILSSISSSS